MYKPLLLPLALQDIKEAAQWYNTKQKGLGKRFTTEVRKKVKHICQNPLSIAVRYDDTRCAILDIFPFIIHFSIVPDKNLLVVSAVFHTSLNPDKWQGR